MCWVMPPASPAGDFGLANGIEQAGLAVIDVAHHRHHGRPRLQVLLLFFLGDVLHDLFFKRNHGHDAAECLGKAGGRRHIQRLIDRRENSAVEQFLQYVLGAHVELFRQVADGNALGDGDFSAAAGAARQPAPLRAARRSPTPGRVRTGCSLRSPSSNRFSSVGRARAAGLRS